MKKLLSVLLVVCMLISTCVLFTSCAKVNVKDVEKNPYQTITEASMKTTAQFFTDDANISKAINKTSKNGAITISLESKTLLGEIGINKISDTIYMNTENQKYVNDIFVNYNNQDLAARLFIDKDGILINSEDILNNANTYGIYPETLAQKFKTSVWATTVFAGQNLDEIVESLEEFRDSYKKVFENEVDVEAEFIKITGLLNQQLSEEKIDKNKYIVISYTISNQTIKAVLNEYKDDFKDADLDVNDLIEEIDDNAIIDLTVNRYLNKKTGLFDLDTINGSITAKTDGENSKADIEANITYGTNSINFNLKGINGDDEYKASAILTKENTDATVKYSLTVSTSENDEKTEKNPFTYTYTKESGDFTLEVDLDGFEIADDINGKITIAGNVKGTDDTAEIAIKSIKHEDITLSLDFTVKFDSKATMPEKPTDAKDVIDMTEDDLTNVLNGIQTSKLGKALGLISEL